MIITLNIDDKSNTGKSVLDFLKNLSHGKSDIRIIESVKDDELAEEIKASLKSGKVSRHAINKTLKTIIEQ